MRSNDDQDAFSGSDTIALPSSPESMAPSLVGAASTGARQLLAERYEILGLVGEGGMGTVYRARDTELDEVVALKVLRDELAATPELIERFRREVKLARRVTHANVARMFDIGEHAGTKFLTMEFIDGEALSDVLRRSGRLPTPKVLELGAALCAGLAAAHKAGVVHRDLKPDNVMLARDGRVLITDFGIAREPLTVSASTSAGLVVGTPAYMAPEQVEARADIDARADIYALGVMLFELSTGELPWTGPSAIAVASARLHAPPPDARARHPGVPAALAGVLQRCMALRVEERYGSAEDVATALASASPTLPQGGATASPEPTAVGPSIATSREKTVAVLPFRNLGSAEDDFVAEGLTDDLIDTLSMTPGLRVRARGAVAKYRSAGADPRDVGRELDVQVIVEGSVRRGSENVRLSARVTSVEDGFQLWAQRFDRPANDLLVVSDETARAVADALTLQGPERKREAPTDPVAVELYLRARTELRKLWPEHVERALALFRSAHERAPDDSSILAGYARACARSWFFTGVGAEQARDLAQRALDRSPDDAEALLAAANVKLLDGDEQAAAVLGRRTLLRAPENPDALELAGRLLLEAGEVEAAVARLEQALAQEPNLGNARLDLLRSRALLGDFQGALELLDGARGVPELAQSESLLRSRLAVWSPVVAATLQPMPPTDTLHPGAPIAVARLTHSLLTGTVDSAGLEFLRQYAAETSSPARYRSLMCQLLTEYLSYFGEHDEALHYLELGVTLGLFDVGWLDRCPVIAPLRKDPRFVVARAPVAQRAQLVVDALLG